MLLFGIPSVPVSLLQEGGKKNQPPSHMLRITELRLPLEHTEAALEIAILKKLDITKSALIGFSVFKRSYDARKKDALLFVYSVDVSVHDEAALLKKLRGNKSVGPTPDTSYHFVGHAASSTALRPIVVGFGPCGIFAALILAQMGFKPIVFERGDRKSVV